MLASRFLFACVVAVVFLAGLAGCSSPEEKVAKYNSRGEELLKKGEPIKARLEFQNALQVNPNSVPALVGLADIAERNRDWPRFVATLGKVIELDPKQAQARVKLAKILLASGQLDKAMEMSDAAMRLQPDNADAMAVRAAVFLKLHDNAAAVRLATQALAKDPRHVEALVVLASERLQAGDGNAALAFLDKGLATNERNLSLQLIKVQALEQLSRTDGAEQVLQKIVSLYPENADYRYMLGKFYLAHGNADKAEAQYRQVATATAKAPEPKLELIRFMREVRGLDPAAAEIARLIAAEPRNHDLKLALAQLRLQQKNDKEAQAIWRQVIADAGSEPAAVRARAELAGWLLAHGDKAGAKPLIDEIVAKDSRNEQGLALRAAIAMDERRLDDAVADLRTILRDVPDSPRAQLLLARTHEMQGLNDLAQTHYARAAEAGRYDPQYAMPYVDYLLKQGRANIAEGVLRDVLRVAPRNAPAQAMLAQTYLRQGNLAAAQALADEVGRAEKDSVAALQIKGAVQASRREFDGSIASFRRAHERSPTELQPLAALVRSYLAAGKSKEAVAFVNSVVANSPRNTSALLVQGQLLTQVADRKGARGAYEKALEIDPKNLAAYQGLAAANATGKEYAGALAAVDRGLKVAPDDFGLRLTRAGLYEVQGQVDEAIKQYEALLAERPNAVVAANNLASLLADYRSDEKSLKRAYELAQRFRATQVPHFRDTVGWTAQRLGKSEEAGSLLAAAAKELPELAVIQYHYGMNQLALNNRKTAREALQRAVDLSKNSPFPQADDARRALQGL